MPLIPAPRNPPPDPEKDISSYPDDNTQFKPDFQTATNTLPQCVLLSEMFPMLDLPDSSVNNSACCSDRRVECNALTFEVDGRTIYPITKLYVVFVILLMYF
jgi:hypothetical protein